MVYDIWYTLYIMYVLGWSRDIYCVCTLTECWLWFKVRWNLVQSEQRSECRVDTGCRAPAPAVVVVPLVPWFGSTVSAGRPVVGSTGGERVWPPKEAWGAGGPSSEYSPPLWKALLSTPSWLFPGELFWVHTPCWLSFKSSFGHTPVSL